MLQVNCLVLLTVNEKYQQEGGGKEGTRQLSSNTETGFARLEK